jgi:hypothetical protein
MTYTCPARDFAADTDLSKLQRLQTMDLRVTGKFPKCISIRELHMAFQVPYI